MTCPPDVADIVLELIGRALIRIRMFGWAGESDRCAVEADHVHNLPDLISKFSAERLRYYWEVERPCYVRQTTEVQRGGYYEPLWDDLRPLVEAILGADPGTATGAD